MNKQEELIMQLIKKDFDIRDLKKHIDVLLDYVITLKEHSKNEKAELRLEIRKLEEQLKKVEEDE
jgi:hypothetical protein